MRNDGNRGLVRPGPKAARSVGLRKLFYRSVWILTALLLICQILIWWQANSPWLAVIEHFALQLSGLAVLGAVLSLLLRRWPQFLTLALLFVTLAWPVFPREGSGGAYASVQASGLRVVSANLWRWPEGREKTLEMLMKSDADIIGMVEMTPEWREHLKPLFEKYPYRSDCVEKWYRCETVLLSRLPIVQKFAGRIDGRMPMIAGGEVDWGGKRFTILVTHLVLPLLAEQADDVALDGTRPVPLVNVPATEQAKQAANLAEFVALLPTDLVLMGDLNGAQWSRVQKAFRAKTGLRNKLDGALTWPSWLPWPLRLPLDHILSRGHVEIASYGAMEATDSDHLPVTAEIVWKE